MNVKETLPTGKAFDLHHGDNDGALYVFTEAWGHFMQDMQIVHGIDTSFLEGDVMEWETAPVPPTMSPMDPSLSQDAQKIHRLGRQVLADEFSFQRKQYLKRRGREKKNIPEDDSAAARTLHRELDSQTSIPRRVDRGQKES